MVACPRISSTASSITRLTALQRRHQAWHGGLPHLSTVMGNTCCRSQQMACLSEFWLFTVSHKPRRKNGEAPSSSSTTTGWAMMMLSINAEFRFVTPYTVPINPSLLSCVRSFREDCRCRSNKRRSSLLSSEKGQSLGNPTCREVKVKLFWTQQRTTSGDFHDV